MLIKIPDAPDEIIAELRSLTGEKTGSKAVWVAAQRYPGLVAQVKRLQILNAHLEETYVDSIIDRSK